MEKSGAFTRLAAELSLEERSKLLEKLRSQSTIKDALLYEELADNPAGKKESRYEYLPWLKKLLIGIVGFFKGRSPQKLYEDYLMAGVARSLEKKAPGLYQFQKDLLLPRFQEMLVYLRDNSRFFYPALDASLNQNRGGLLVFLGSFDMPGVHGLIEHDSDPSFLLGKFPGANSNDLKKKAHWVIDDAASNITGDQKALMYLNARSLNSLRQLSAFSFDRVINSFSPHPSVQGMVCSGALIREQLVSLNNILHSLREPPSMSLLGSLFVFALSKKQDEENFNMQLEMQKLLFKAEIAIEAIRDFNRQIPLTLLLRCISRDLGAAPQKTGGGEDWFAAYKDHWKNLVNEKITGFVKVKQKQDIQNSLKFFFRGSGIKLLENIESPSNENGIPLKCGVQLSFIQTFHRVIFAGEIDKILHPVFIDGEFIKKENRLEFTEWYNTLVQIDDSIKRLDRKLDPEGDYGKRYFLVKEELSPLTVKRSKTQIILDEIFTAGVDIIRKTNEAMSGMIKVLGGILEKNEKHDTLSNFETFAKDANFPVQIRTCAELFGVALKLMENLDSQDGE